MKAVLLAVLRSNEAEVERRQAARPLTADEADYLALVRDRIAREEAMPEAPQPVALGQRVGRPVVVKQATNGVVAEAAHQNGRHKP